MAPLALSIIVGERRFKVAKVPGKLQRGSVGDLVRQVCKREGSVSATVRGRSVAEDAVVCEALAAGDEVVAAFGAARAGPRPAGSGAAATRRQALEHVARFASGDARGAVDGLRAVVFREDAVAKYTLGAALVRCGEDARGAAKAFGAAAGLAVVC